MNKVRIDGLNSQEVRSRRTESVSRLETHYKYGGSKRKFGGKMAESGIYGRNRY